MNPRECACWSTTAVCRAMSGLADRQPSTWAKKPVEVLATYVLHGERETVREADDRVGRHDVRVRLKPLGRLDLAQETGPHAGTVNDVLADDLDDLFAPGEPVADVIDRPHPATGEFAEDRVVRMLVQAGGRQGLLGGDWRIGQAGRRPSGQRQPGLLRGTSVARGSAATCLTGPGAAGGVGLVGGSESPRKTSATDTAGAHIWPSAET